MNKIGFIPLRKGSKGIPNKNKKKLVGRPLFSWVLAEAIFSELDTVYVFTDDEDIMSFIGREYSWTDKVKVLERSASNADDTASTESAIDEFCAAIEYDFDLFCLLQATSPFTSREDINKGLQMMDSGDYDSCLSVVRTHRFVWKEGGSPVNYDPASRPRRQDFDGLLVENGALYMSTKKALKESGVRVSGNIGLIEMAEESLHEIDSMSDWLIVEQLLIDRNKRAKDATEITHLVLDVDGVFTNGMITYDEDGEFAKEFDMRDGMGLELLRENGVQVIVMTSEDSEIVKQRMKKLKLEQVNLGVKDKFARLQYLMQQQDLSFDQIAYMGDDVNDLCCLTRVGWSCVPANGMLATKIHSDMILNKDSGNGAIRSLCEFIINYNKRYQA